jgi:hypothetical protein
MRRFLVAGTLAVSLALTACGGGKLAGGAAPTAPTAPTTADTGTTAGDSPSTASTAPSSTDGGTTGTTGTTSGGTASGACPVGRYTADAADIDQVFSNLPLGGQADIKAKGSVQLELKDDQTYTITANGYGLSISGTIQGNVDLDGTLSGTYTATNGVLSTQVKDNNLKGTATIGGVTIDASAFSDYLTQSLDLASVPYQCQNGNLVLQQANGAGGTISVTWKAA